MPCISCLTFVKDVQMLEPREAIEWFFVKHNKILIDLISLSYGQVILVTNNMAVIYVHDLGIWKMRALESSNVGFTS